MMWHHVIAAFCLAAKCTLGTSIKDDTSLSTIVNPFDDDSPCNGFAALCPRQYSDVAIAMTRCSHAVQSETSVAFTQTKDITTQLQAGVRGLWLEVHPSGDSPPSQLRLCFVDCAVNDGGTLQAALTDIEAFLDENPREVITVVVRNPRDTPASAIEKEFQNSGISRYAYRKNAIAAWPTMEYLIEQDQRLVILLDSASDTTSTVMNSFSQWVAETNPYMTLNSTDFPSLPWNTQPAIYMLNHFVSQWASIGGSETYALPVPSEAGQSNSWALREHVVRARLMSNFRWPSILAVDFFDEGNVLLIVNWMNAVYEPDQKVGWFYPKTMKNTHVR